MVLEVCKQIPCIVFINRTVFSTILIGACIVLVVYYDTSAVSGSLPHSLRSGAKLAVPENGACIVLVHFDTGAEGDYLAHVTFFARAKRVRKVT